MADFDLVVAGNLVLAERIVENGFVAVSGGNYSGEYICYTLPNR